MPNRILREGILTSERVNSLTAEEEVFYRRLHSIVNDQGIFEAHPALLRARMYPLKLNTVRESNISRLLARVAEARLVRLYDANGKHYLQVRDFRQQQRSESQHPLPPDDHTRSTCVADAQQPISNAHLGEGVGVFEGGGGDGHRRGGAQTDKPANVDEVLAYIRELSEKADLPCPLDLALREGPKFFDHFEANGWKQGGRTTMRSWRAALRNWLRRSSEDGAAGKISPFAAPKLPFDPTKPNAHTGGVEVVG